jgi:uncharacterized membrane protein YjdF
VLRVATVGEKQTLDLSRSIGFSQNLVFGGFQNPFPKVAFLSRLVSDRSHWILIYTQKGRELALFHGRFAIMAIQNSIATVNIRSEV